jgi:hypothetical protein
MEPAYLSAAATFVVGLSISVIAYQQWVLARHKFRLDLFDRRYKVYDATVKFVATIYAHANFTDEDLHEFNLGTMDAVFLYPKPIKEYLEKIRARALHMRLFGNQSENMPVGDKRSKIVKENHDEFVWLTDQLLALPDLFSPYLGFQSAK